MLGPRRWPLPLRRASLPREPAAAWTATELSRGWPVPPRDPAGPTVPITVPIRNGLERTRPYGAALDQERSGRERSTADVCPCLEGKGAGVRIPSAPPRSDGDNGPHRQF